MQKQEVRPYSDVVEKLDGVTGEPDSERSMIEKTIEFWRKRFGVELSQEDAREAIQDIVSLFSCLSELDKKYGGEQKIATSEPEE